MTLKRLKLINTPKLLNLSAGLRWRLHATSFSLRSPVLKTAFFGWAVCVFASANLLAADVPGPKQGSRAPNFKFKTADGRELDLTTAVKHSEVALVFYRSAEW